MIRSMTGFGRGEAADAESVAVVEIKAVNNRHLEVSPRMPRELGRFEGALRSLLRSRLERGKLSINVSVERVDGGRSDLVVDSARAAQVRELLNAIRKSAKIKEGVTLDHVLQFREELISRKGGDEVVERQWALVEKALKGAVDALEKMRTKEGKELAKDMLGRISGIDQRITEVEKISSEAVPAERTRLRERIARLFENDEVDEHRLEMEIVILADKLDVTEEIVRWRSHSKHFREAVDDREPAGRRMNFLLQEMLREINTIGSKSNDAEIARLVIEAKEELERIREQVQNIE